MSRTAFVFDCAANKQKGGCWNIKFATMQTVDIIQYARTRAFIALQQLVFHFIKLICYACGYAFR